jgi:hypothetical protein
MEMREPTLVPMSTQVIAIADETQRLNESSPDEQRYDSHGYAVYWLAESE